MPDAYLTALGQQLIVGLLCQAEFDARFDAYLARQR